MRAFLLSGFAAGAALTALTGCVVQPATPVAYAPPPPATVVVRPAPVVVVRPPPPPPFVVVRPAPPPVIIEQPGPPPGPYYVFRRGHWFWNGYRWIWAPGHYVLG